ncbi:hypothetical protein TcCL_NonESM06520, partial [Trypanosoma cruzi]
KARVARWCFDGWGAPDAQQHIPSFVFQPSAIAVDAPHAATERPAMPNALQSPRRAPGGHAHHRTAFPPLLGHVCCHLSAACKMLFSRALQFSTQLTSP